MTPPANPGRKVKVMGVLNVTPDSFSDGGRHFHFEAAVEHGLRLAGEGADYLDIGGESSRPGADPVPEEVEMNRVIPVIRELASKIDIPISIDTTKAGVAEEALKAGAVMVNDISAMEADPAMLPLVAQADCRICLMHMQGTPQTMQASPHYSDSVEEIRSYLDQRARAAVRMGVHSSKIFIDPGIGFGKRLEDNLRLLNRLDRLCDLGYPVLIGTSRKSFVGTLLKADDPHQRLYGSLGSLAVAVEKGASVLRVHDVRETREMFDVIHAIRTEESLLPALSTGEGQVQT